VSSVVKAFAAESTEELPHGSLRKTIAQELSLSAFSADVLSAICGQKPSRPKSRKTQPLHPFRVSVISSYAY